MGDVAPGKRDPRDPVQDDLFACLDAVQAAVPALGGLQIFGVPRMLLTVLQHLEQVFYLEPRVLLSADARSIERVQGRAAELRVPFRSCLPRQEKPIAINECCPTL
jgi:hypothetical protein